MNQVKKTTGRGLWVVKFQVKGHESLVEMVVRGDTDSHAKQQIRNRFDVLYVVSSRKCRRWLAADKVIFEASQKMGLV